MKNWSKKIGVAVALSALAVTGLSAPAFANSKTSITMADSTAGSVGIKQIASPWFNSGALSQLVMFRGLFRANPDLATVKPDLASGHKVSKDGKTYTITLRSGLKWSDGKPITTDDVIWSMNTVLRVAQANAIYVSAFKQIVGADDISSANTKTITGLTVKGNDITIQLTAPQQSFLSVLGQFMILPKHVLEDESVLLLATNNFWKNPVTSGPFKVGTLSPDNFITLVPNPNFEGAKPKITEINVISSANPVADARSGKIDYFTSNDAEVIRSMQKVSTFKSNAVPIAFYRYFVFNLADSDNPLQNVKSREALIYGVNWNSLIKLLYPNGKVINSGVTSGMPHHDNKIPKYTFNPTKAKELLKEADFDFSKTVRLRYYHGGQADIAFMTAVAQQMISLGMKVDVLKFQGDATTELVTTRKYDLALKGLSAFNVSEWYSEYSNSATYEKVHGPQPEFAALSLKLSQATSFRQTAAALKALQKLEQEKLVKLTLNNLQQYVFVSKRIAGTAKFGNPLYIYENNFANWSITN